MRRDLYKHTRMCPRYTRPMTTPTNSGAAVMAAFAEPTRRAILDRLVEGERAVSELVAALRILQPAVSQHLRVLLDAGLVTVRAEGRRRIYRASPEGLARVRAEVERYWQAAVAQMKDDLEQPSKQTSRTRRRR